MAIGDLFVEFSGDNASLSIQPAVGVTLMATSFGNNLSAGAGSGAGLRITDGVDSVQFSNGAVASSGQTTTNIKVIGNNTNYFLMNANGAGEHTCITGVEI